MNVLKRLVPFILLNILVSAGVTWGVLTYWTQTHPPAAQPTLSPQVLQPATAPAVTAAPATRAPLETPQPSATPQPAGVKLVELAEVGGAGNLANEVILLRRVGEGELRLNGWRLDDNAGHRFLLPDMVLFKGGAVRVYTRSGTNTVNELFWGLKETVWASGKTAALYDEQGNQRAMLLIP